ncbi:MAG: GNAT family N-acetyltransferase [Flavobacteriaceae bacterium]
MVIDIRNFDELSKLELYELLRLRAEVFVVEQQCAYQDLDGKDVKALHILGKKKGEELVAYARVFEPGFYFEQASIGRIVVAPGHRAERLGKKIVLAAEKAIIQFYDGETVKLSAQSYLKRFYNELGYRSIGEEYLEDGIPHIAMVKNL